MILWLIVMVDRYGQLAKKPASAGFFMLRLNAAVAEN